MKKSTLIKINTLLLIGKIVAVQLKILSGIVTKISDEVKHILDIEGIDYEIGI